MANTKMMAQYIFFGTMLYLLIHHYVLYLHSAEHNLEKQEIAIRAYKLLNRLTTCAIRHRLRSISSIRYFLLVTVLEVAGNCK